MTDATPDVLSEAPDEPVIHWMERPPMSVAPIAVGGAIAGVLVLGALAAIGAMTLLGVLDRD